MTFTKSSRKPTRKVSSDSAAVSFDLLSNLTYMAALATGGPERDVILEWTIKQDYKTVGFFRQVYLLSKRLGFEYARAFRLVAKKAKTPSIKNLLLRRARISAASMPNSAHMAPTRSGGPPRETPSTNMRVDRLISSLPASSRNASHDFSGLIRFRRRI